MCQLIYLFHQVGFPYELLRFHLYCIWHVSRLLASSPMETSCRRDIVSRNLSEPTIFFLHKNKLDALHFWRLSCSQSSTFHFQPFLDGQLQPYLDGQFQLIIFHHQANWRNSYPIPEVLKNLGFYYHLAAHNSSRGRAQRT